MSLRDLLTRKSEPETGVILEVPLRELVAAEWARLNARATSDDVDELSLEQRVQLQADLCMLTMAGGMLQEKITLMDSEDESAGLVLSELSDSRAEVVIQGKAVSGRYERDKIVISYHFDDERPGVAPAGHLTMPERISIVIKLASLEHHLHYGLPIAYGGNPLSAPMLLWLSWDEMVAPKLSKDIAQRMGKLCVEALGSEPNEDE